jgi:pyruvate kinase
VRRAEDVEDLKRLVHGLGGRQRVIAKIEKLEAIEQLEAIVAVTDALMVARGDLGVEIGAAEVPMLQKRLIRMGREAGKTVITATQMLESMIAAPEPTRAEASDVANAIRRHRRSCWKADRRRQVPGRGGRHMVLHGRRGARVRLPRHALSPRQGPRHISDVVGHAVCDMAEIEAASRPCRETGARGLAPLSAQADRRLHAPVLASALTHGGLGRIPLARPDEGRRDTRLR